MPNSLQPAQAQIVKSLKKSSMVKNLLKSKQQYKLKKLFSNYMVDNGKCKQLQEQILVSDGHKYILQTQQSNLAQSASDDVIENTTELKGSYTKSKSQHNLKGRKMIDCGKINHISPSLVKRMH